MEVVPRVHKRGTLRHYSANVAGPGLAVHPDALPEHDTRMERGGAGSTVPVPCGVGDALIMYHMTPHGSGDNTSGLVRWAADLRYNAPEGAPQGGVPARISPGSAQLPIKVVKHRMHCSGRLRAGRERLPRTVSRRAGGRDGGLARVRAHAEGARPRSEAVPQGLDEAGGRVRLTAGGRRLLGL